MQATRSRTGGVSQLNRTRRNSRISILFFDDHIDQLTFSCLKMTPAYPGHELEGAAMARNLQILVLSHFQRARIDVLSIPKH